MSDKLDSEVIGLLQDIIYRITDNGFYLYQAIFESNNGKYYLRLMNWDTTCFLLINIPESYLDPVDNGVWVLTFKWVEHDHYVLKDVCNYNDYKLPINLRRNWDVEFFEGDFTEYSLKKCLDKIEFALQLAEYDNIRSRIVMKSSFGSSLINPNFLNQCIIGFSNTNLEFRLMSEDCPVFLRYTHEGEFKVYGVIAPVLRESKDDKITISF